MKFKLDGQEWQAMNEDSVIVTELDKVENTFDGTQANKVGAAEGIVLASLNTNYKAGDIVKYKIFAQRAIGREAGKKVFDVPVEAIIAKKCK